MSSSADRDDPAVAWTQKLTRDLAEIEHARMPFGRYGGRFIYDLPFEYLAWFATKNGFPKGRLGELLEVVYAIKRAGADRAFAPLRAARGNVR
jgi:uncharacterized protein (DUF3820 family)